MTVAMLRPSAPRPFRVSSAGFTLVELLIVVILLGILSAIVLPQMSSQRAEAVASTLQSNVTQVAMVLECQKQKTVDGSYPAAIDTAWFLSGQLPHHPDAMAGVPMVETVRVPGLMHPRNKLMEPGAPGAYWYNSATGAFRARVKSMGSVAESQALYEQVNGVVLAPSAPPASGSPLAPSGR